MPVFIEDKRMPGYEITSIDISSGDTFYIGGSQLKFFQVL